LVIMMNDISGSIFSYLRRVAECLRNVIYRLSAGNIPMKISVFIKLRNVRNVLEVVSRICSFFLSRFRTIEWKEREKFICIYRRIPFNLPHLPQIVKYPFVCSAFSAEGLKNHLPQPSATFRKCIPLEVLP